MLRFFFFQKQKAESVGKAVFGLWELANSDRKKKVHASQMRLNGKAAP
jgi:hypothetical protein